MQHVFERLLSASESHLGGKGAAFVGRDESNLALAVGVRAPRRDVVRLLGKHPIAEAAIVAGSGHFNATTQVDLELDALARSSDA